MLLLLYKELCKYTSFLKKKKLICRYPVKCISLSNKIGFFISKALSLHTAQLVKCYPKKDNVRYQSNMLTFRSSFVRADQGCSCKKKPDVYATEMTIPEYFHEVGG